MEVCPSGMISILQSSSFANCRQQAKDFFQVCVYTLKSLLREVIRMKQQAQPVLRFIRFFQSNAHFRSKIRLALPSLRFRNIGSDTRSGAHQLLRKNILFSVFPKIFTQFNNSHRKRKLLSTIALFFIVVPSLAFIQIISKADTII